MLWIKFLCPVVSERQHGTLHFESTLPRLDVNIPPKSSTVGLNGGFMLSTIRMVTLDSNGDEIVTETITVSSENS